MDRFNRLYYQESAGESFRKYPTAFHISDEKQNPSDSTNSSPKIAAPLIIQQPCEHSSSQTASRMRKRYMDVTGKCEHVNRMDSAFNRNLGASENQRLKRSRLWINESPTSSSRVPLYPKEVRSPDSLESSSYMYTSAMVQEMQGVHMPIFHPPNPHLFIEHRPLNQEQRLRETQQHQQLHQEINYRHIHQEIFQRTPTVILGDSQFSGYFPIIHRTVLEEGKFSKAEAKRDLGIEIELAAVEKAKEHWQSHKVIEIDVPERYTCPVTCEPFVEPVVIATGHTYEKFAILDWFRRGNRTCPVSNKLLDDTRLVPNMVIFNYLEELRATVRRKKEQ